MGGIFMTGQADQSRALLRLNRAAKALAEATSVVEVVAVRDVAEAARVFAKSRTSGWYSRIRQPKSGFVLNEKQA